jgi:hypothetical protein
VPQQPPRVTDPAGPNDEEGESTEAPDALAGAPAPQGHEANAEIAPSGQMDTKVESIQELPVEDRLNSRKVIDTSSLHLLATTTATLPSLW